MSKKRPIAFRASLALVAVSSCVLSASAQAAWNVRDTQTHTILNQIKSDTGSINSNVGYIKTYFENTRQSGEPTYQVISNVPVPSGQRLAEVPEDFGLKFSCGAEYRKTAADLRALMSTGFSLDENAGSAVLKDQQESVCGAMRVLANIRYNESVKLVNEVLPQIKSRYENQLLDALREEKSRDQNNAGRNQVTLQAAQFEFDMVITAHRERQLQYQQYESMLSEYNSYLGRRVMDGGKRDLVSTLVGSSVIQLALGL
jgi:hypothetical protein